MTAMDKPHLIRTSVEAAKEVFARPAYLGLAVAIALAAFLASLWIPNYKLIGAVFITPDVTLDTKLQLLASLLAGISTNFGAFAAFSAATIPLLFGVDIAMLVYFLRRRRARLPHGEIAASVGGAASGVVAAGCAACGSFLLVTILSFLGASGALALLPLQGGELGLLSIALLLLSIFLIARKIAAPVVCEIKPPAQPPGNAPPLEERP
ncbi:hypothetical protein TPL01_21610 [Sulfuriferula plumbiphila]|uniref:Uncharacterized protein n=1 Tax=Sulfuriferula plumbiphila TaxID=171865 RepID=A0A512L974_9PROT|nr:hypothetical protein [Sulfuriferula plumbiphila]BBP03057.1 hypothetical protein SFPGR_04790 [Sulfuriferula plumbiphila]GEP31023.1 hypothetical protein TPL01_21610 [Sulfuriferula plumbiphila]